MKKNIQLTSDSASLGSITVNPKMLKDFKVTKHIQFGTRTYPIEVRTSEKNPVKQANISEDILEKLNIPLNCQFEIYQKENTIQIGPYIGLLAGYHQKSVKKRLNVLLDYLYHYDEINGAIIAFSLDKIDSDQHTIEGFLYNPLTNAWDEGIFPYPNSIFIITGTVSSKWIKHFQSFLGDCVFNDFYLNKWDIHKILASSPTLTEFLPTSILYKDPQDIYTILEKYSSIIIKSVNASKGSDIYKIELNGNSLDILYPKTGETNKINLENTEEANIFFNQHFEKEEFMIQEALQLISHENRTIDFRAVVLKNGEGKWQVMGLFARHGKPGNILSNIAPKVKSGEETIKEVFGFSDTETSFLVKKIYQIAIESVKELDKIGIHFGNTGVDISIDKNKNMNIIEIQHCNPSHSIAFKAGLPELYYEILKSNMLYAKKLAGF